MEGDRAGVRVDEADGADDDSREGHSLGSGGRLEVFGRIDSLSKKKRASVVSKLLAEM